MKTFDDFESTLRRIMVAGTALAAGGVAASTAALRPDFSFQPTFKSAAAFVFAAIVVYYYWKIIFHASGGARQNLARIAATGLLAVGGIVAFLYPARFVASSRYPELAVGLVSAVCALSCVAALLFACRRFFEGNPEPDGSAGES